MNLTHQKRKIYQEEVGREALALIFNSGIAAGARKGSTGIDSFPTVLAKTNITVSMHMFLA